MLHPQNLMGNKEHGEKWKKTGKGIGGEKHPWDYGSHNPILIRKPFYQEDIVCSLSHSSLLIPFKMEGD